MTFYSKYKKWLEPVIWVVVIGGLYLSGYHVDVIGGLQRALLYTGIMKPEVTAAEGENMPKADYNYSFTDLEGNTRSLAEYKGKTVFLNFWATWCPPCIAEMPGIEALYQDMASENVVFLLVSRDKSREKVDRFLERKDYTSLPVVMPASPTPEVFRSNSIPSTYVIDPEGNIRVHHEGMADYDTDAFRTFLWKVANE